MSKVHLTLAISEYDHVRDLTAGIVQPQGIDLTCLNFAVEEIFYRYVQFREWDVSETPFGQYASLVSQGDNSFVAIPVFPSRVFRHSAFFVRRGSDISDPRQLAGKRIGVPEWAQTACVYGRGLLTSRYGLRLQDVDWYQAGVNQPGRTDKVKARLPEGLRYTPVPNRSLDEMLQAGDLDAIISAHPPESFGQPDSPVIRLFRDPQAEEEAYWRDTGVFPIMHTISIRRDVYERYPWVAMNLYEAFDEARRRSLDRAFEMTASRLPLPWGPQYAARWTGLFGDEYWPYGLEPNRPTLEAFLRFAYEQGICHRLLAPEDLFPKELTSSFRI